MRVSTQPPPYCWARRDHGGWVAHGGWLTRENGICLMRMVVGWWIRQNGFKTCQGSNMFMWEPCMHEGLGTYTINLHGFSMSTYKIFKKCAEKTLYMCAILVHEYIRLVIRPTFCCFSLFWRVSVFNVTCWHHWWESWMPVCIKMAI